MCNHRLPIHLLLSAGSFNAYYTTRGVEPVSPYAGFNVCHYTGDTPEHYATCRKRLADAFGLPVSHLVIPRQTHSVNIAVIDESQSLSTPLENVDGIVTNRKDIIIGVNTADCVPLIMVDPRHSVIAAVHAGWRGAVGGVIQTALETMIKLGASPGDIRCAMGPSICQECFEVGEEVASQFPDGCVDRLSYAKPHVSLQHYTHDTLISCGIRREHITPFDNTLCTRCHPDNFFSARAAGINSGRVFTFVTAATPT